MKTTLEWMNLTYDVEFVSPAFDLPTNNTGLLKALHGSIDPRFQIKTRDMHVTGGNLLSDVHVRIDLFGGNGAIDVSADGMSLVFNNVRTAVELKSCQDCISLSEEALREALPTVRSRTVAIRPTLVLQATDNGTNVGAHLSRLFGSSIRLRLDTFGTTNQVPGVNIEVRNPGERWDALFHGFRDHQKASSFILNTHVTYHEDGAVRGLENRVGHLKRLLKAFLDGVDLELEGLTDESGNEST